MSEFATTLRTMMRKQKLSASDVARALWGTTKDARGYKVAKNRDRIGHYLSGHSFPNGPNLVKIANLFGIDPLELYDLLPAPAVRKPARSRKRR